MKKISFNQLLVVFFFYTLFSCNTTPSSHEEMIQLLKQQRDEYNRADNYYASASQVIYYDSLINSTQSNQDKMMYTFNKCYALIASGREEEAIPLLEVQVEKIDREGIKGMNKLKVQLALAYFRMGERKNCLTNHTAETCILPIQGTGIHKMPEGSRNAARMYEELLKEYPDNMEYRWLLNLAYMTLGEYPANVPCVFLIPGSDAKDDSAMIMPFKDIASGLRMDVNNMAGGTIVDDFDNDGYLDVITSSWDIDDEMHYFKNNGDGNFIDQSEESKLKDITGGLNLMQMDFNNDGFKDVFVLRGA
ncbi:MAG TPA: VCBS repeat-containing protein, partial [Chryseolinea sp.]|nr:VCBS repeat-containing protein [Chryseolinea sp.]